MKRLLTITFLLLAASGSALGADETISIGMMPKMVGIDYFIAAEQGAKEAAEELGVKLVYDGPVTNDVTKQAEMLDTWIMRKFDVIAVSPNDPHALAPTLKKAMKRGVKVVTWDADSDPDSRHVFVNQATYEAIGHGLVDVMAEQIGGAGEVAIITASLTDANQNAWMEHMRARIAEKYPEMKIVAVKPSEVDQQLAVQITQDLFKTYPNLKGIFGITSVALPGAALGARQSDRSGTIAITGLATPKIMSQFVKDGTVKTFLLWSPVDLGYLTVYAAKLLKEKGELPAEFEAGRLGTIKVVDGEVLLGPPLRFNADNIDDFDF